jgi:hypothetical protein
VNDRLISKITFKFSNDKNIYSNNTETIFKSLKKGYVWDGKIDAPEAVLYRILKDDSDFNRYKLDENSCYINIMESQNINTRTANVAN